MLNLLLQKESFKWPPSKIDNQNTFLFYGTGTHNDQIMTDLFNHVKSFVFILRAMKAIEVI